MEKNIEASANVALKRERKVEDRFKFTLTVIETTKDESGNDVVEENLICSRALNIIDYIEGSMYTAEFREKCEEMVKFIQEDLNAKSRIMLWTRMDSDETPTASGTLSRNPGQVARVQSNPEWSPEFFIDPLIPADTYVLKFSVYDRKNLVYSRIWDGRYYPSYVRKNIDLTNNKVEVTYNGMKSRYNKEDYFTEDNTNLYGDLYALKHMIMGRDSLIPKIMNEINDYCSSANGYFESLSEMTVIDKSYGGKSYNINQANANYYAEWGKVVAQKTRDYVDSLYIKNQKKGRKPSTKTKEV